jgi:hypothetical protein
MRVTHLTRLSRFRTGGIDLASIPIFRRTRSAQGRSQSILASRINRLNRGSSSYAFARGFPSDVHVPQADWLIEDVGISAHVTHVTLRKQLVLDERPCARVQAWTALHGTISWQSLASGLPLPHQQCPFVLTIGAPQHRALARVRIAAVQRCAYQSSLGQARPSPSCHRVIVPLTARHPHSSPL